MITYQDKSPDCCKLHSRWMRAEVSASLQAIEDFSAAFASLEAAGDGELPPPERRGGHVRETLEYARQVERSFREAIGGTLRILRHLKRTGVVDQAMEHWTVELERNGPRSFHDHWNAILEDSGAAKRFRDAGVSDRTIQWMTEAAARMKRPVEVRDGELVVGTNHGHAVVIQPRKLLGGSVADLLYLDQFDAAVDAFSETDLPPVDIFRPMADGDHRADPFEIYLAMATRAKHALTVQVRELEDFGIASFRGDAWPVVLIIVAIALVAAAILVQIICHGLDGDEDVCDILSAILGLFGMIAAALFCAEEETCEFRIGFDSSRSSGAGGF